jgi:hypothetical protein
MIGNKTKLPIACSLTQAELSAMRDGLLPGLLARAAATEAIPGGLSWRFQYSPGLLKEIGAVIDAEHQCCPFLRFIVQVEAGGGPVVLEVTGPEGTEEFLAALLGTTPQANAK